MYLALGHIEPSSVSVSWKLEQAKKVKRGFRKISLKKQRLLEVENGRISANEMCGMP